MSGWPPTNRFANRAAMILEYSEKGIVFFPDPYLVGTPADFGLKYDDVLFEAADHVRLHGWWVPKAGAPVLVWFHGNAGNISHRLENIKPVSYTHLRAHETDSYLVC